MEDTDNYTIRPARPADLGALPAIERAAATLFRATPYPAMADAPLASEEIAGGHDLIWVAVAPAGEPVGFAIVQRLGTSAHLHELDVHPAHARHGLGRRLIEAVAAWAKDEGLLAVTLTTFLAIPWNAPYYARLGFRPLAAGELDSELRAIRQAEAAAGLPITDRLCMRLDLTGGTGRHG